MAIHGLAQPTYYIAKSALKSSVVLQAVWGHFRTPTSDDIVFGKETAIELLVLGSDGGLESLHEQLVFGTIKDLKRFPWNEESRSSSLEGNGKDLLAVLSDSGKLSFLTFSIEAHRFIAVAHINVTFPGLPRELGHQLAIEFRGRAVAVAGLEDRVAIFPASADVGVNLVEKGLLYPRGVLATSGDLTSSTSRGDLMAALGTIWSMAFVNMDLVPGNSSPSEGKASVPLVLAVLLRRRGAFENEVHIITCNKAVRAIQLQSIYFCDSGVLAGALSTSLISVPTVPGAFLLARSGDFVLFDVSNPKSPKALYQAFISVDNQQAPRVAFLTTLDGLSVPLVNGEAQQNSEGSHNETEPSEEGRKAAQSEDKEGFDLLLEAADIEAALLRRALQEESARRAIFRQAEVERYREGLRSITSPQGVDSSGASGVVVDNPPIVAAWSWEVLSGAGESAVLLVATDAGSIHRVYLTIDESIVNTSIVQKTRIRVSPRCYQGPICTSLLCLTGGYVAAVGDMGDGHVLHAESNGLLVSRSSLQNVSPMFDFELVDYDGEKQDQMVACCGAGDEGTMRVIRNAISVEQLLTSPPSFPGITATWPLRIRQSDKYHSLLVMSFLEETRVLSVGLNFDDRTDTTGFNSGASTLACGRVEDGWLVQICASEIRLCSPAMEDNAAVPLVSSWSAPTSGDGGAIRVGAVAQGVILVALSRLGTLFLLGTEPGSVGIRHVVELQRCYVNAEISCISIPQEELGEDESPTGTSTSDGQSTYQSNLSRSTSGINAETSIPCFEIGKICVVGTYQPSVEILSLVPGEAFRQLAVEPLVQVTPSGTSHGGCIPESVQLIHVDRLYVLVGLRNGMLLRYHWHASPVEGPGSFRKNSGPNSSSLSASGRPFLHQPSMQDKIYIPSHGRSVHISGNHAGRNWEPAILHLMDVRRIGVSPVSLTLLRTSLHSDVVALSDRPWLLQAVQHRQQIAYTPISFRASSHATALSCIGCPLGLLFIADCCLHLVEMEQSKRLSVQQIPVGRTPRHLVYHSASKTLIIICTSTGVFKEPPVCEVRCIDPVGGQVHFTHKLEAGELALSVQVWQPHGEQLVVVGTGPANARPLLPHDGGKPVRGRLLIFRVQPKQSSTRMRIGPVSPPPRHSSPPVHPMPGNYSAGASGMPAISTDPISSWSESGWMKDNLVVRETFESRAGERLEGMGYRGKGTFQEGEGGRDVESGATVQAEGAWELQLHTTYYHVLGPVMCLCTYLGNYLLAGAGNALIVLSMVQEKNGDQRLKRMSKAMTRFGITCIATNLTRIAVGDCRDGVLLYSYREDTGQLELLLCDPSHRLVADCTLIDPDTAIVTDKHGNLCSLTTSPGAEGNSNPERNLGIGCWFHMAEIALRIRKGSLSYRAPVEDMGGDPYCQLPAVRMAEQLKSSSALVAATMLGSVLFFLRLTREEYELLAAVERRVAAYPLTAPLLGNDHALFRSKGSPPGVARVLDGDMLEQFLALPMVQQQTVLAKRSSRPLEPGDRSALLPCHGKMWLHLVNEDGEEEVADIPLEKVLRLLERVHHSID